MFDGEGEGKEELLKGVWGWRRPVSWTRRGGETPKTGAARVDEVGGGRKEREREGAATKARPARPKV